MMLGRMRRNARPVVREKSGGKCLFSCAVFYFPVFLLMLTVFVNRLTEEALLWRMFCPDFKGEVVVVAYEDGEEGFNSTIRDKFRVPDRAALEVVLPQGKGIVVYFSFIVFKQVVPDECLLMNETQVILGPWETLLQRVFQNSPCRSLVISGFVNRRNRTSRLLFLLWCRRWQPADDKKRKGDAPVPGGQKAPKLRITRGTANSKPTTMVTTETWEEPVSLFATPPSSPKVAVMEVQKEDRRSPSIEMVTLPSVQAEDTAKKTAGEKPKSPAAEKPSGSTAAGTGVEDQHSIQPRETELEFYYRPYAVDRGLDYHRPPWNVMQGDDISNDPSACRDILGGLGTPFETLRAHGLPRENRINQLSSMLVGSSIIANAIVEDYNALGRGEEDNIRLRAEVEAMVKAAREGTE
ncbi:hypothetical protein HanHA300_Chr03g0091191 [Helianthus annuus]|nr:hypothetical protein HanHA300_Chr03g0091191 [Helianthus annuus]